MKSIKSIRIPDGIVRQLKLNGVVLWKQNVLEQLTAPTITLDGDTLTITTTDDRTEQFVILVDGVETAVVETHTVSGTWNLPGFIRADFEENVSFTSNGVKYSRIKSELVKIGDRPTPNATQRVYYNDTLVYEAVYDVIGNEWKNEDYSMITFDGVQEVSKEFKQWLEEYAVKQVETVQVSGTWVFNETIVKPTVELYEKCIFNTSEDRDYGIYYNGTDYFYYENTIDYSDQVIVYDFKNNTWTNQAYRTITFAGKQTVSKEFYEWLVENTKTYPVSGTWQFNKTLSLPDTRIYQLVDYKFSNGYEDGGFNIRPTEVVLCDSYTNNATMYTKTEGWSTYKGENFRTITFVGTQTVSKEFYDWFTANAVRQITTFAIGGTTFYADKNMTWGEWVDSQYDTGVEEGGTILTYFVDVYGGSYIVGTNEEIPIGSILRSNHGGGGGYVVRLNGVCVLNTDTIMPTAYEEVRAGRN